MPKLGQHFLTNKKYLQKIAEALQVQEGNIVIEIGPGHGSLTAFLANACAKKSCGALIIIEKDKHLARKLEGQNFQLPTSNSQVNSDFLIPKQKIAIIEGDALKILPALVENCVKQRGCRTTIRRKLKIENSMSYKLVGNIPYYITGRLLRIISELDPLPEICVFTIQREVAQRITAGSPYTNLLAAAVQIWAKPEIISTIPPHAFNPPPKVAGTIIRLIKISQKITTDERAQYYQLVRILFKQPRKTILNNLANNLEIKKLEIARKLQTIDINPSSRPQNLAPEDIIKLSQLLLHHS